MRRFIFCIMCVVLSLGLFACQSDSDTSSSNASTSDSSSEVTDSPTSASNVTKHDIKGIAWKSGSECAYFPFFSGRGGTFVFGSDGVVTQYIVDGMGGTPTVDESFNYELSSDENRMTLSTRSELDSTPSAVVEMTYNKSTVVEDYLTDEELTKYEIRMVNRTVDEERTYGYYNGNSCTLAYKFKE